MNINTYTRRFTVKCPNDDAMIDYTLMIQSDKLIMVEKIKSSIDGISGYHEIIADILHETLGGRQVITAVHQGVEIKTVRGDFNNTKLLSESIRSAFLRNGFSDWELIAQQVMEDMQ